MTGKAEKKAHTWRHHYRLLLCVAMLLAQGCVVIPAPVKSHYNRGVELYDEGKTAEAIRHYKLALRAHPENYFAAYNLAVAYQDQGKDEEALALYSQILRRSDDAASRINMAAIHYKRGNGEEAFQELEKAAAADRDSPVPHSILGEYLEREERWAEAEKQYAAALRIDEKDGITHYRMGRLLLKRGSDEAGITHLEKALSHEPAHPASIEALAGAYEKQGDTVQAITLYERLSVIEPDRADIYFRLGELYSRRQSDELAVTRYWSAAAIDANYPLLHERLRDLFQRLMNKAEERMKAVER